MGNEELQRAMGERISKRRKQLGFTQEQLAAGMDVSTQMISYVEQGRKAIRPENLIKLCSVLD
ncbi:MAG: helix-turn-helix transcriptional regulator, partial [Oscillospiraceae bacterium]|nr:helix-turn-helix transcriptional regulator [Oscillospiraceae bacterium]